MKKTIPLILAISLCSMALADQETTVEPIDIHASRHTTVSDTDRLNMIGSFVVAAISGVALKRGQAHFGVSTAVHGAAQVANALWCMGSITKNDVLHDLSVRTLLASGATALAGLPGVSTLVATTPFIGEGLKAGAQYTTALLTVSAYKAAEKTMEHLCKRLAYWELSVCATF